MTTIKNKVVCHLPKSWKGYGSGKGLRSCFSRCILAIYKDSNLVSFFCFFRTKLFVKTYHCEQNNLEPLELNNPGLRYNEEFVYLTTYPMNSVLATMVNFSWAGLANNASEAVHNNKLKGRAEIQMNYRKRKASETRFFFEK